MLLPVCRYKLSVSVRGESLMEIEFFNELSSSGKKQMHLLTSVSDLSSSESISAL